MRRTPAPSGRLDFVSRHTNTLVALLQLGNSDQHVLLVPKETRLFLPGLPTIDGLDVKSPQQLKDDLVQLSKGDKLSCAHPTSRAKGELDHAFHLCLLCGVALDEPLRTKDVGIWPKDVVGHQHTKQVVADSCSAREEDAVDGIAAGGHGLEVSIQRRWANAYGFVDYSLTAGNQL